MHVCGALRKHTHTCTCLTGTCREHCGGASSYPVQRRTEICWTLKLPREGVNSILQKPRPRLLYFSFASPLLQHMEGKVLSHKATKNHREKQNTLSLSHHTTSLLAIGWTQLSPKRDPTGDYYYTTHRNTQDAIQMDRHLTDMKVYVIKLHNGQRRRALGHGTSLWVKDEHLQSVMLMGPTASS